MKNSYFNNVRLLVALIGFAMLILAGLLGVLPIVDLCIAALGFAVVVLFSSDKECLPWTIGFSAFYMIFLFLGYHFPLLVWEAPDWSTLEKVAVYGNKLAMLLVNAFLYFLAAVASIMVVAGAVSGFYKLKGDSSLK